MPDWATQATLIGCAVISAFYSALSYHFPRAQPGMAINDAPVSTRTTIPRRTNLPWRTVVFGALSIVLAITAIYSSPRPIPGPQGPRGQQGAPGPQGAPPDPRIEAAVNAITRSMWLELRYEEFKGKKDQLISELKDMAEANKRNPMGSGKPPSSEPGYLVLERYISQMVKDDFVGQDINFHVQPILVFGQNNGEKAVENLTDAQNTVDKIDALYSHTISRLRQEVRNFGKMVPNPPN